MRVGWNLPAPWRRDTQQLKMAPVSWICESQHENGAQNKRSKKEKKKKQKFQRNCTGELIRSEYKSSKWKRRAQCRKQQAPQTGMAVALHDRAAPLAALPPAATTSAACTKTSPATSNVQLSPRAHRPSYSLIDTLHAYLEQPSRISLDRHAFLRFLSSFRSPGPRLSHRRCSCQVAWTAPPTQQTGRLPPPSILRGILVVALG